MDAAGSQKRFGEECNGDEGKKSDERLHPVVGPDVRGNQQIEQTSESADGAEQHGGEHEPASIEKQRSVRERRGNPRSEHSTEKRHETDGRDEAEPRAGVLVFERVSGALLELGPVAEQRKRVVMDRAHQLPNLQPVFFRFGWALGGNAPGWPCSAHE